MSEDSRKPTYRGQDVLVTGAGGFIGGHLVEELLERGANVTPCFRYTSHKSHGALDIEVKEKLLTPIYIDLEDPGTFPDREYDTIFHLGAAISEPFSATAPMHFINSNIIGTQNLLNTVANRAKHLVIMSTSEIYGGTCPGQPLDETHWRNPRSPYAATKIAADALAIAWANSKKKKLTIARPFNTYGPGQSLRAVIPQIVRQLQEGDIVRLGNQGVRRDFVYVGDTVDALCLLGSEPPEQENWVEYNICTGTPRTLTQVAEIAAKVLGRDGFRIVRDGHRMRDQGLEVDCLQGEGSKLEHHMGWKPEVSLEDGIAAMVDYYSVGWWTEAGYEV